MSEKEEKKKTPQQKWVEDRKATLDRVKAMSIHFASDAERKKTLDEQQNENAEKSRRKSLKKLKGNKNYKSKSPYLS
jgi:hypothetical protein